MRDLSGDWQVEVQGQIYVADFEELKQWIAEGAVLPSDRVKRGELRWLAAEKVPELHILLIGKILIILLLRLRKALNRNLRVPSLGSQLKRKKRFRNGAPKKSVIYTVLRTLFTPATYAENIF